MKDKIHHGSAHARRHRVHDENACIAVAAWWAFVVVTSVTVAWSLQKPAEFRAS